MRREAAHALVVRAREVADAGPLDLDDARAEVGELTRAKGAAIACSSVTTVMPSSGRTFDAFPVTPSPIPYPLSRSQKDLGSPSTCSATYAKIMFVDTGATW